MHLLGKARIVLPQWEPDQGWRVLDPDGHQVDAGGQTIITATIEFTHKFTELYGTDGNSVPLLDGSRR
jgi:hypothetical protein